MNFKTESKEAFWDSHAAGYDDISMTYRYQVPQWIVEHANEIDTASECRVLDLACGTGSNLRLLLSRHAGIHAEGVDISPKMIEHARATGMYEKLHMHDLEVALHDVASDAFDLVVACGFLEFLSQIHVCLTECHRALKVNGMLWATFRRFEADDPFSPPRVVVLGPLKSVGYSASEILFEMSSVNLQVTSLDAIDGFVTKNGFTCPYYALQARKKK